MLHKLFLCSFDYLKIANEKNQSFGVYCGEMSGKTVVVTGEYAVITFHSDGGVERKGFWISFTSDITSLGKKRFNEDIQNSKTAKTSASPSLNFSEYVIVLEST